MKKYLFLGLMAVALSASLCAQHHFPEDSAEWKVWHIYNGVPYSSYLTVHELNGDTVLLGQNFKTISPGFFPGWDSYIREVDSTHKVYFLLAADDTLSDRLLYDFSKSIGDTIKVIDDFGDTTRWIVVNEGLDSIGSGQRRYLDVKRDGWNYVDRWIEGIGSVRGLFAPFDEPSGWFEHEFQLVCFMDKGTGIQYEPFPDPKFNCNTPAHVFDVEEQALEVQQVKVYPNPFSENLILENLDADRCDFVLMALDGKEVIHGSLQAYEKRTIRNHNLSKGLYFLQYKTDNQLQTVKITCQ